MAVLLKTAWYLAPLSEAVAPVMVRVVVVIPVMADVVVTTL